MSLDFRGKKLRGKKFSGRTDLQGADFSKVNLSGADFRKCDLTGARFDGATLLSTRFDDANLTRASLTGVRTGCTRLRRAIVTLVMYPLVGALSLLVATAMSNAYGDHGRNDDPQNTLIVCCLLLLITGVVFLRVGARVAKIQKLVLGALAVLAAAVATTLYASASAAPVIGHVSGFAVLGALAVASSLAWIALLLQIAYARIHVRTFFRNDFGLGWIQLISVRLGVLAGTSFRAADLESADFSGSNLKCSDFEASRMVRTNFRGCQSLQEAWPGDGRWHDILLRKLLTEGQAENADLSGRSLKFCDISAANLKGANLSHSDLTGALLEKANLRGANLAETQALGTSFKNAVLTGACLRDWNIDSRTEFTEVECEYFFLLEQEDSKGSRDRRPHQAAVTFSPGAVEKLFTQVRETIDLLLEGDGDRQAWQLAFARLMREYPSINPEAVQSVKRVAGAWVITLEAPKNIDKEGVADTFQGAYARALGQASSAGADSNAISRASFIPLSGPVARPRLKMFVGYAHADESFLQQFLAHASPLKGEELVADIWCDNEIRPGEDWASRIEQELKVVDLIVLLISSNFFASQYCYEEMTQALARHFSRQAVVIPVILRDCDWRSLPIGRLKALPKDGRPVKSWPDADQAWTDVIRRIRESIADLDDLLGI